MNYNPNMYNAIHTVRLTFQQWEYTGHIAFEIGGNCKGAELFENVLDDLDEDTKFVENDCKFKFNEPDEDTNEDYADGWFSMTLKNKAGDELSCNDTLPDDLPEMLVAVEIVDVKEEANE